MSKYVHIPQICDVTFFLNRRDSPAKCRYLILYESLSIYPFKTPISIKYAKTRNSHKITSKTMIS